MVMQSCTRLFLVNKLVHRTLQDSGLTRIFDFRNYKFNQPYVADVTYLLEMNKACGSSPFRTCFFFAKLCAFSAIVCLLIFVGLVYVAQFFEKVRLSSNLL